MPQSTQHDDDELTPLVERIADRLDRMGRKEFVLAQPRTDEERRRLKALQDHAAMSRRMKERR